MQCSAAKDKAKFMSDARKTKIKSVVEKYVALHKAQNAKAKKHRSSASKKDKEKEKTAEEDQKKDVDVDVDMAVEEAKEAQAAPA
jgi:hypothetical protein